MRRPSPTDFAGRALGFVPADPSGARTLHPDQVAHFNEHGFIGAIDVFPPEVARDIRHYVDGLLAATAGRPGGSYAINGFHRTCAGLWDLATDPRITACVRDLVGAHAVCWGTHLFAKLAHDEKIVPFHQDAIYWPFEPSRTVTAWLAVDDADEGNAAVTFVPGSHRGGPLPHDDLDADGSRVLTRAVRDIDAHPARAVNELRAGQMSLHCDLLLHGSPANRSARRRAGLTLRYAAAEVRVAPEFDAWRRSSVHVLDGDPSGWWPNLPRPPGEDPTGPDPDLTTAPPDAG